MVQASESRSQWLCSGMEIVNRYLDRNCLTVSLTVSACTSWVERGGGGTPGRQGVMPTVQIECPPRFMICVLAINVIESDQVQAG
jgi:hypothetical protein